MPARFTMYRTATFERDMQLPMNKLKALVAAGLLLPSILGALIYHFTWSEELHVLDF